MHPDEVCQIERWRNELDIQATDKNRAQESWGKKDAYILIDCQSKEMCPIDERRNANVN